MIICQIKVFENIVKVVNQFLLFEKEIFVENTFVNYLSVFYDNLIV